MKRRIYGYLLMISLLVLATAAPALSDTYFIYDQYGGTWHDANKTGNDDSLMCWAAAAANVLAYENWGTAVYNTDSKIFQDFVAHWTNNTGDMSWAWNWWFSGVYFHYSFGAYPNVPGGGNYYPNLQLANYVTGYSSGNLMSDIDTLLHQGKDVAMVIGKGGSSHAVTVWGFDYSAPGAYQNIYITDSDDGHSGLQKYSVTLTDGAWYLGGGYSGWRIGSVEALASNPSFPQTLTTNTLTGGEVPIAPSWLLFGTGILPLVFRRRRRGSPEKGQLEAL